MNHPKWSGVIGACVSLSCASPPQPSATPSSAPISASAPSKACQSQEHRQFDFWVGTWDAKLRVRKGADAADWNEAHATNRIAKILGGCAIEENFQADGPGDAWSGKSVSMWIPAEKRWRQTWVDDQGSYLAFTGGMNGADMILTGEPSVKDGKPIQMRMVFTNIAKDSFSWRWERTSDGGATWSPMMTIEYTRHA